VAGIDRNDSEAWRKQMRRSQASRDEQRHEPSKSQINRAGNEGAAKVMSNDKTARRDMEAFPFPGSGSREDFAIVY
jgi:hypothetical protein